MSSVDDRVLERNDGRKSDEPLLVLEGLDWI
jgi:hypothetical protein